MVEHAGTKNMKPLGRPGNEEYDKSVRAKIKGSGSNKRKFAQSLSALKRGAVNEENIDKKILELVTSPIISAIQLQELTQMVIARGLTADTFDALVAAIGVTQKTHQHIHGSRIEAVVDATHTFKTNLEAWRKARQDMLDDESAIDIDDTQDADDMNTAEEGEEE